MTQYFDILSGTTCFAEHARYEVCCERTRCRQWIAHGASFNCIMIAASKTKSDTVVDFNHSLLEISGIIQEPLLQNISNWISKSCAQMGEHIEQ